MLQRMTRPQHTGTHIVEASSAAMSLLAGCEFRRIIHWNLLTTIRATAWMGTSRECQGEETETSTRIADSFFPRRLLFPTRPHAVRQRPGKAFDLANLAGFDLE